MFKAIIDFFKNLFGFLKPPPPAPEVSEDSNLPKVEETEPQDGSEITPDSSVVVINEEEPIFEEEAPDPFGEAGSTIETPVEETEPTTPPPTTVPEPIETPEEETIEEPTAPPKPKGRYLWCLDNGHGKRTAGKRSPVFDEGQSQFFEYEFNRDIVRRIIDQLEEEGVQYFNVVPEVDTDNFLEGRVARANNKESELPKIFLSVHSNAGPARSPAHWSTASGIETWYYYGSKKGRKLASIFQSQLMKRLNWKNRNIRTQKTKQFYVLRNTNMPAVLTENGFYNNREEVKLLLKTEVRQLIADAHIAAILQIERDGV